MKHIVKHQRESKQNSDKKGKWEIRPKNGERNTFLCSLGVKPLIHQSELGTYTKVVPFQEKSSFHFVVL